MATKESKRILELNQIIREGETTMCDNQTDQEISESIGDLSGEIAPDDGAPMPEKSDEIHEANQLLFDEVSKELNKICDSL